MEAITGEDVRVQGATPLDGIMTEEDNRSSQYGEPLSPVSHREVLEACLHNIDDQWAPPLNLDLPENWLSEARDISFDLTDDNTEKNTYNDMLFKEISSPSTSMTTTFADFLEDTNGQISDDELVNLPVKELNLRLNNLPKEIRTKLKYRRRTIKNRGYALNCRSKRKIVKSIQENESKSLNDELEMLKERLAETEHERDQYKYQVTVLSRQLFPSN